MDGETEPRDEGQEHQTRDEGEEREAQEGQAKEAGGEGEQRDRRTVNPEQAREMLGSNEASAIDIRDEEKWRDGHLPGARHCPDRDFDEALEQIDDDQTVIV